MPSVLSLAYQNLDWQTVVITFLAAVVSVHLIPYLVDRHNIRKYPGPFLAKFSDIWLGWASNNGHRSEVVHEMHQKYGP
jgi:benzoate 4-monooxygenase